MGGYGIYATKITMVSKERKKTDHHIAVRLLMTGPKTIYTKNEDVWLTCSELPLLGLRILQFDDDADDGDLWLLDQLYCGEQGL